MEKRNQQILMKLHQQVPLEMMSAYVQHGQTTTYQHCLYVASLSCWIAEKLQLYVEWEALIEGAMLHDFYGYDWHIKENWHRFHGFRHPKFALRKATHYKAISKRTQEVILCHMWPLTFRHIPFSKEAWIVCVADKICALLETIHEEKQLNLILLSKNHL